MPGIRFAMLAAAIGRVMEPKGFIRQEAGMLERRSALNLLMISPHSFPVFQLLTDERVRANVRSGLKRTQWL